MEIRGPVEILGAIVDEVEGLRRTDPKSHLPECLLREARAALEVAVPIGEKPGSKMLKDARDLEGRVVSHVFTDDLRSGQMVIACADGSFMALEVEGDRDEDGSISVMRGRYSGDHISAYLRDDDLVTLGLMTNEEKRANALVEKLKQAKSALERAESQAAAARLLVTTLEQPA